MRRSRSAPAIVSDDAVFVVIWSAAMYRAGLCPGLSSAGADWLLRSPDHGRDDGDDFRDEAVDGRRSDEGDDPC